MPHDNARTTEPGDFGILLEEILDHLSAARDVQWPVHLAVIDHEGQMMLQTVKAEGGCTVHYLHRQGALGFHMRLWTPMHLLLVDGRGRAFQATIMETGQWLLG